jgi:hypothetical protein
LYSLVRRAIGVACVRLTGGLPVMMPPSITAPITMSALGSPLLALTNCAKPEARPVGAPPLLSVGHAAGPRRSLKRLTQRAAGAVSTRPPGFGRSNILRLVAPCAGHGKRCPTPASARRGQRRKSVSTHSGLDFLQTVRRGFDFLDDAAIKPLLATTVRPPAWH